MMIELTILIITLLAIHYAIFLLEIFIGLNKIFIPANKNLPDELISIIIPFRNEMNNIIKCYNSLAGQNYPQNKHEIIFVNDESTDESLNLLITKAKAINVKIFSVPNGYTNNAHKKSAVLYGISKANGEIIVTTDADCTHPKNWLRNLLSFMDEETGFVSGPVQFYENDSLFKKMQSLEFAALVITGAGLIGYDNPIICNAANIAYRKKIFEEVGGFDNQMALSSGDDELLMQKIYNETNYKIKFAMDKEAIVSTHANHSIKEFFHQRKRWASKGLFYSNGFLIIKLILIFLFYLSLIVQPIIGLIYSSIFFISFLIMSLTKIGLEYLILKRGYSLLYSKNLSLLFIVTEFFQVPYIIIVSIAGIFGNLVWKDRKVKR